MNQERNEQASGHGAEPGLDPVRLQQATESLRSEQNLPFALVAGLAAALIGAGLWATVTYTTGYQIGWMAVGVGFLVGFSIRASGKGLDGVFGWVGAGMAFLGCALGNLMAVCAMISAQEGVPFMQVLGALNPALVWEMMVLTFHPMDLLFYGIALYEGYKLSFRQVSEEELGTLLPELRETPVSQQPGSPVSATNQTANPNPLITGQDPDSQDRV